MQEYFAKYSQPGLDIIVHRRVVVLRRRQVLWWVWFTIHPGVALYRVTRDQTT